MGCENSMKKEILISSDNCSNVFLTERLDCICYVLYSNLDMKWQEFGICIAEGNELNQLKSPSSVMIDKDDDKIIYIVDSQNDRILEWNLGENFHEIVAGGNGKGKQMKQLICPIDMINDSQNDCFIISDYGNKRIMQWPRQNSGNGQILISNINCYGLAIDKYGFIYVADCEKHEVRKWNRGDQNGKLVAGGNGKGTNLNQLNYPSFIFVDDNGSLYISDCGNHRVMKWLKDAKQGILVAGGNGEGDSFKQFSAPQGIIVDQFDHIYVADRGNNRVMCWIEGATKGSIAVGGNGCGNELNQLFYPMGLSFDQQGNLYVVDSANNRIIKFEIDLN